MDGGSTAAALHDEKLLREIDKGSLFQLLSEAKRANETNNHVNSLHIRQIDDLIRSWRSTQFNGDSQPVLELTSASSAAGKTTLLYYVAAKAILPKQLEGIELGGSYASVVFIDTDGRFDANRLRDIAFGIVIAEARKQGKALQEMRSSLHDLFDVVSDSLKHVHVFRPTCSAELLTVLKLLPSYLLQQRSGCGEALPDHHSAHRPVHSIMLDSASASYYQDARAYEVARLLKSNTQSPEATSRLRAFSRYPDIDVSDTASARDLVSALRGIQMTFRCAVIFTTMGLYPITRSEIPRQHDLSASGSNGDSTMGWQRQAVDTASAFRPYLPGPWRTYPTCRFVIRRQQPQLTVPSIPAYPVPSQSHDQVQGDRTTASVNQETAELDKAARGTAVFVAVPDATVYAGYIGDRTLPAPSVGAGCSFKFTVSGFGVEICDSGD